jgi:dTDP-4-amino-4,6-dideoxygalactose transaminase
LKGSLLDQEIPFLELKNLHQSLKEELMAVFSNAVDNAAFIGGPNLSEFEEKFAVFTQTKNAIGVSNGTDALRLAMIAMELPKGAKVITVPNTFIATCEAISQAQGSISFVDVDLNSGLMCLERLEEILRTSFADGPAGQRPAMILPVHLYGQCADMDGIQFLADKYELKVLEDAAQSHGATYKGRPAGSLAEAAAFSFYPGKNLGGCGDAGAVTTNNPQIAANVTMLRDHGQKEKYVHQLEGYNCRLDSIQAGFLTVKLNHILNWNEQRQIIAAHYDNAFLPLSNVRPIEINPYNVSSRHLYVVHVFDREGLLRHLKADGISAGLHYPIPLHLQPCYSHLNFNKNDFPNTEKLAKELISLPIFPGMSIAQADRVIASLKFFVN